MASIGGPNVVNSGLIFGYDTGQPAFSNNLGTRLYRGRPTTNEQSGIGMSTYNNVPGNVSSVLEGLSETFQGAQVIKQTLTPADASGVSYLSNGNNPGIGVVTSGGGGQGGVYTGHSIFFKPTVPMHSSPIFTNYSNIGGWQSSNLYEAVGDGWFRAYVTWYGTNTGNDGKYWAINPLQAVVNQPIVIYWAGPFREALNSQAVSPYVYSSRGTSEALIDQRRLRTIDLSGVSFSSTTNAILFDGSDDNINTGINNVGNNITYEAVVNSSGNATGYNMFFGQLLPYIGVLGGNRIIFSDSIGGIQSTIEGGSLSTGVNYHVVCTRSYNGSSCTNTIYVNGTQVAQGTFSGAYTGDSYYGDTINIGDGQSGNWYPFYGSIHVARLYNRALSATEISQNFQAFKPRFGL